MDRRCAAPANERGRGAALFRRAASALAFLLLVSTAPGCRVAAHRVDAAISFAPRGAAGSPAEIEVDGLRFAARFTRVGVELSIENRSGAAVAIEGAELAGVGALSIAKALPAAIAAGESAFLLLGFPPRGGALEPSEVEAALARDVVVWSPADADWRFESGRAADVGPIPPHAFGELWPRDCEASAAAREALVRDLALDHTLVLAVAAGGETRRLELPFRIERLLLSRLAWIERWIEYGHGETIVRDRIQTLFWVWFREDGEWRAVPQRSDKPNEIRMYRPGPIEETIRLAPLRPTRAPGREEAPPAAGER